MSLFAEASQFFNQIALYFGYLVLLGLAFLFVQAFRHFMPPHTDQTQPSEMPDGENEASDIISTELPDGIKVVDVDHRPDPICSWDWSMGDGMSKDEVMELKSLLREKGYYAHPFPRSPRSFTSDRWYWGRKNMGIWNEKPTWIVRTERGGELEVEPDLSDWRVNVSPPVFENERYGPGDSWERENIYTDGGVARPSKEG